MGQPFLIALALLAGAAMAVQPGVNSVLGRTLDNPLLASTISFLVGTVSLVVILVATGNVRAADGSHATLASWQGWWLWTGGLLGAYAVTASLVGAPRLGITSFISLFLVGQLATSIVIDHFGLVGFGVKPMSAMKAVGVGLVLAGAVLVRWAS